ncbi:MAG: aminomethyl-transferring glycine dehydrogenase subunit GcvPA [Treponemataceae bacterium]|nr:MAG: aminomethyl-transferring glycine dehydrogenase subunit GcvPA [Treponemataceae bacterium]
MGNFIPNTDVERSAMLHVIGAESADDLFAAVPQAVRLKNLKLPGGKSELEVIRYMEDLAAQNTVYKSVFRGAGAYRHYIPAAVQRITANETFLTAYTPYQAEMSQGVLQSIFEYQTMICELTGMDAANASLYDGASAAAEAVNMCRERGQNRVTAYVSGAANPQTIQTMQTYCAGYGITIQTIPCKNGATDSAALKKALADGSEQPAACVYIQQPNFFGIIEDLPLFADIAHNAGAKLIAGCNPIALGILQSPGEAGADIAVGEGQPLGLSMAFGGPFLGFMSCKTPLLRKLPGRIAGETKDAQGRRAFVLTLQAREQHIRREKASSNVCSNEAHCALTAAVYLAVMGPEGLAEAARQCRAKSAYLAKKICAVPGFALLYGAKKFFHEFVTVTPGAKKTLAALEKRGILGGLALDSKNILWCATELNTKEEIDELAAILAGK